MKIIFFGDAAWAEVSLRLLHRHGYEIAASVLRRKPTDNSLFKAAEELKIPILQPKKVNSPEFLNQIARFDCDLFLSVSYDQIIKKSLIEMPQKGFVNFHAGKLPFYRGRSPINWAIINGEKELGLTAHFMDEGIDTGDIIKQCTIPIAWTDSFGDVMQNVLAVFAKFVLETTRQLETGNFVSKAQAHLAGSYFRRRGPGDEWIDWKESSENIYNKIRGISKPGPGALSKINNVDFIIWSAVYEKNWPKVKGSPGEIIEIIENKGVRVQTGDSTIIIEQIQIGEQKLIAQFETGTVLK